MSNFRKNDISITGDGNAVGDNNRLTFIRNERHHHDHRSSRTSGGGTSSEEAGPVVFGAGAAAIAACVVGSYFFALHAQAVYLVLQLVFGAELLAAFRLMYLNLNEEESVNLKAIAMALLSGLGSAALFVAHADYREELTGIAQAANSATQFWCGMNDYGRELSLMHMVTGIAGFGFGGFLLALPSGAMFAERVFSGPANGKGWALIDRFSSWSFIVLGAVLVLSAVYFHTDSGWNTWLSTFGNPPTFFCKNVAPVLR